MRDRKELEAWADAFLDQHRSPADRRARARVDPDLAARLRRYQRIHQTAVKWEGIFMIVGVVLLLLFGIAFYGNF
jgi:hypothetical protein